MHSTCLSIYKHLTFDYLVSFLFLLRVRIYSYVQTYSNMLMLYLQFIYSQEVVKVREITSFQRMSKQSDSTNLKQRSKH